MADEMFIGFRIFKLFLRLVSFAVFLLFFGGTVIFIALASLGWIDIHKLFPGLPRTPSLYTQRVPGDPFRQFTVPPNLRPRVVVPPRGRVQLRRQLSRAAVRQYTVADPR